MTRLAIIHTFTLVFRSGEKAVLQVCGAESLDEARAYACGVLPVPYEIRDGDETNGRAKPFRAWTSVQAQQSKPLSDLTDTELEKMCDENGAIIDRLVIIHGEGRLTEQEDLQFSDALDLGEILEPELLRRLIEKACRAVAKAQTGGHQ